MTSESPVAPARQSSAYGQPALGQLVCQGHHDVRLVADAYGDSGHPAVLLLHGGGQTRHSWGATAQALASRGMYAVSADLRGHGDSGWDPAGDYSFDAFQQDTEQWCQLLGMPAIVGASMGGLAGLWTEGARAAQGIEPASSSLVLVDIAHRSETVGIQRIVGFMNDRPDGFATLDEVADAIAAYMPQQPRPASSAGLARNVRLGDDGRYRWHWDPRFMSDGQRPRSSYDSDAFAQHASRLTMPVLLIRGRMSDVVSQQVADEFRALVPHAEFVDVGGAAHMVAGDQNDVFADTVIDFLQRVMVTE